jgi:hypothetical protein
LGGTPGTTGADFARRANQSALSTELQFLRLASRGNSPAPKNYFLQHVQSDVQVQSRSRENTPSVFQKNMFSSPHPAPTGGAYRDRHGRWMRDAMDAQAA